MTVVRSLAKVGMAVLAALYFRWILTRPFNLPFKFPQYANLPDAHNPPPGRGGIGKSEGIMYIGNADDKDDQKTLIGKIHGQVPNRRSQANACL